jgi:hypothetical protein
MAGVPRNQRKLSHWRWIREQRFDVPPLQRAFEATLFALDRDGWLTVCETTGGSVCLAPPDVMAS